MEADTGSKLKRRYAGKESLWESVRQLSVRWPWILWALTGVGGFWLFYLSPSYQYEYSGIVQARTYHVSSLVSGRVDELFVQLGSSVGQGDPLVQLDDSEIRLRIDLIESQLGLLRSQQSIGSPQMNKLREDWRRAIDGRSSLLQMGLLTESQSTNIELEISVLQRQLDLLRLAKEQMHFGAPFSGIVTGVFIDDGEYVKEGSPILILSSDEDFVVEVFIPEHSRMPDFKNPEVEIIDGRQHFNGSLITVSPALELLPERLRSHTLRSQYSRKALIGDLSVQPEIVGQLVRVRFRHQRQPDFVMAK